MKKSLLALLTAALFALSACPSMADIEDKPVLKGLVETGVLVDDPCTGPCYEDIAAVTGYRLQMDVYDPDQAETKINLALASGEDYDFIRGSTSTMMFNFIENGALASLNEAIDQGAPELKAAFPEEIWREMTMDDGGIYAIPSTAMPRLWNGLVIRQDWLDKLDLDAPQTTDELLNVLRAFRDGDPGDVGADRIIPFSTAVFTDTAKYVNDDPLLGAFGIANQWVERDGKLVNRVETPEYREYVAFYKKLYEEGLLDVDIAVNKDNTLMEKMNKGLVGAARYAWNFTYQTRDIWATEHPDWELRYIANPAGPGGARGIKVESGIGARIVVPRTSKNVSHVVNFANEFVKHYEYLMIGEEGETWEEREGVRVPILPAFNERRGDTFWYQPVSVGEIEYPMWLMRVYKLPSMGKAYSDLMNANEGLQQADPVGFTLNLPVTQRENSSLLQLEQEYLLKIIVGELPLTAVDELIAQWNANGGAESTAEVNAWYAAK